MYVFGEGATLGVGLAVLGQRSRMERRKDRDKLREHGELDEVADALEEEFDSFEERILNKLADLEDGLAASRLQLERVEQKVNELGALVRPAANGVSGLIDLMDRLTKILEKELVPKRLG